VSWLREEAIRLWPVGVLAESAIVVTKEAASAAPTKRVKIPDVCQALKVPWMNDFQFAREIGIRFAARLSSGF
jgi:hypothetical protein